MKKKGIIYMAICLLYVSPAAMAQKLIIDSGNMDFIKGEKSFKIEYNYDNLTVGKSKNEQEYIKEKMEAAEKKEAGKGEVWLKGWNGARSERYQPKFEELLEKLLAPKNVSVTGINSTDKYTLLVKTTMIEPGFNVGVMKQPAYANFEFIWYESANKDNVLCKMTLRKVPGSQFSGYDFDVGSRVQESYAKGGKILGKYLVSKVLKSK